MKLITLHVPESYLQALDQLVAEQFYASRAEAIRVAIHDLINTPAWRNRLLAESHGKEVS